MTAPGSGAGVPLATRLRETRRALVKRAGQRGIRRLRRFFGRQSRVGDPVFFEPADFPFVRDFERRFAALRREADAVLAARAQLPAFREISPDQARIAPEDWKVLFLAGFGIRDEEVLARCPETARLLDRVPGLQTAFFSILPPGLVVPPHRGITKGLIRAHFALSVPAGGFERCGMRVKGEPCEWREGRFVIFDDTNKHEVWNHGDRDRVVLLFDFARPMRWPGEAVSRAFLGALRRSGYVRDGLRNYERWKSRSSFRRPS